MITNTFILGITGPTSLVVISIIALIIFGRKITTIWSSYRFYFKEFKSATEDLDKESHDTPSKESKQQREQ